MTCSRLGEPESAPERPFGARAPNGDGHGNGSHDGEHGAPAWAPSSLRVPLPASCVDLERDLAEYEKAILLRALDQAGGVKKRAAELLGINYRSLRHRLQKYGLGRRGG